MGWILHTLLVVSLLAYTAYGQDCHPDNIRQSDVNSTLLSLAVEGPKEDNFGGDSDILRTRRPDDKIRASDGIFLTSNDVVSISTNVGSEYLLSILEFTVELLKTSNCSLELRGVNDATLYKETVLTTNPSWNLVEFNLGDGILDVKEIILTFFAPTGELKIRNIFIEYCIQTGWCPWSRWKACSVTCGGGTQFRDRTCECPNPDAREFKCPTDGPKEQSQKCNPDCCEKPPTWTVWMSWGECSTTCGDGTRRRKRICKPNVCPDGTKCKGTKKQTEKCYLRCCPQPPTWGPWTEWGACSVTCEDGIQERTRECIDHTCPDNTKCQGKSSQTRVCTERCCPQPPKWASWSRWGDCSVTCEDGTQQRTRKCIDDYCPDYTTCPGTDKETQDCTEPCCPQPPKWETWSAWGACSVTCEDGTQKRTRKCKDHKCPDYTTCTGKNSQTQDCTEPCCPQPPKWETWSAWGACSVTCEDGTQKRTRKCKDHKCPDYTTCTGKNSQTQDCTEPCCPQPPTWSKWGEWDTCSVTCGGGTQERRRICKDHTCPDKKDCSGKASQTQTCNPQCCPIKPEWTAWTKWSDCSATCGDASRFRTRKCKESPCPGDYPTCPGPKKQTEECDLRCCRMTIDFKNQMGTKVFRKNKGQTSVQRVLRGGKKNIFLIQNDDQTQYLEIQLAKEYNIMVLGVSTLLASYVEVSSMPTSWPPGKAMSEVPLDKQAITAGYFKHKIKLGSSGVGPIDTIKLQFGFPTGEIKVRNLYLIVCPA